MVSNQLLPMPGGALREGCLSYRAFAMLRAVALGRAEMSCSAEPDLFFDGLPSCDQATAHALSREGLIRPARPALVGQRVTATLTEAGYELVSVPPEVA